MPYRVGTSIASRAHKIHFPSTLTPADIAPQGRAGCKNKECKDAAIKIQKGELRFATQVTIQDHTSWSYKHWYAAAIHLSSKANTDRGCATPSQIQNLIEDSGGDTDMVDGFEELPEEDQEKVKFALANGHVPDEDWKGVCTPPPISIAPELTFAGRRVQQARRKGFPRQAYGSPEKSRKEG